MASGFRLPEEIRSPYCGSDFPLPENFTTRNPYRGRLSNDQMLDLAAEEMEREAFGRGLPIVTPRAAARSVTPRFNSGALPEYIRISGPLASAPSFEDWQAGILRRCEEAEDYRRAHPEKFGDRGGPLLPTGQPGSFARYCAMLNGDHRLPENIVVGAPAPAVHRSAIAAPGTVRLQGVAINYNFWSPSALPPSAGDGGEYYREKYLPGAFSWYGSLDLELGHRGRAVASVSTGTLRLWSDDQSLHFEARVGRALLDGFVGSEPVTMLAVSIASIPEAVERINHVRHGWQKTISSAQLTHIALLRPGDEPAHAGCHAWLV